MVLSDPEPEGRRPFLGAVAGLLSASSGCVHRGGASDVGDDEGDDGGGDADDDEEPEELPYSTFDLVHAEDDSVVAFEMDDHWHLHPVEVKRSLPLRFRLDLSDAGGPEELDVDRHSVELEVVSGDPSAVSVEPLDDVSAGLSIHGEREAEVDVVFAVVDRSGDVVYRTTPVPLHVEAV